MLLCPWDSLSKNTGEGCHALFQRIFATQGLNPCLLHCRRILYHLSQQRRHVPDTFSSVQLLSWVWLFVTPWTAARQDSLSITNSRSLLKLMSIESMMPSNHLILCCPPFLPPSIFPSIRVFSNESILRIRWPKYWSFSFNISPSNEYSGLISFRIYWHVVRIYSLLENKIWRNLNHQPRASSILFLGGPHWFFPISFYSLHSEYINNWYS